MLNGLLLLIYYQWALFFVSATFVKKIVFLTRRILLRLTDLKDMQVYPILYLFLVISHIDMSFGMPQNLLPGPQFASSIKGQIISECLFVVLNFPKKTTKNSTNFCPVSKKWSNNRKWHHIESLIHQIV